MAFNQGPFSGDYNKTKKQVEQKGGEDARLKKWKSWMQQRQKISSRIAATVKVEPDRLLMNTAEELRDVYEDKLMLDYAQITTDFDKYRGNPAWWKLPHGLKDKCDKKVNSGHYWVQSHAEKNEIPELEHVGVPYLVQQEKHILPRTRNMFSSWQNLEYKKLKMEQFAWKIELIRPHRPIYEDLIVVGKGIFKQQLEPPIPIETNEETHSENEKFEETCLDDKKKSQLALSINGILLTDSNEEVGSRKLRLNFDYDISLNQIQTQHVTFANSGVATIRICWVKKRKFRLFRDFVDEEWTKYGFCFDINDLILLPGQQVEFPVKFKTDKPGRHCESWEITSTPPLWNNDFHLFLVLQSYAYSQDFKEKSREILEMIEIKTRTNLIRELLDEITSTVQYPEAPVPSCEFDEARLFELANLVHGRPRYLFNSVVIEQLHRVYDNLKQEEHQKNWDCSVKNLERVAREKDVLVYLDRRKGRDIFSKIDSSGKESKDGEKIGKTKKGVAKKESKTNKEKGSKSSDKKNKTKKGKEETKKVDDVEEKVQYVYEPEFYVYSNQEEVAGLLSKLEMPTITNFDRLKYFCATQTFSAYFTKMCNLLEHLELETGVRNNVRYPDYVATIVPFDFQWDRFVYERFDDTCRPKPVPLENSYTMTPKRKPKTLQEIPADDLETIYLTYFNKSRSCLTKTKNEKENKSKGKKEKGKKSADQKSSKGDRKSEKRSSKSGEKSKKGSKKGKKEPREITVQNQQSVEVFDPYAEKFNYVATTEVVEKEPVWQSSVVSTQMLKNYDHNRYVIVYSCLVEAVEALVEVVDSFSCVVSYETLEEVKKWFPK